MFRVGRNKEDLSAFNGVTAGLAVRCPHCDGAWVLAYEALNPSHTPAMRRRPLLLGKRGCCPYCSGTARYPATLGWISDSRPSRED